MNDNLSILSDARLVAQAVKNDQAAFGEIYDRYAVQIYSFCRARLRNDADASDAMQDTFVRAASRLGQLREPEKLRSWLFAIARNQIIATGKTTAKAVGGDAMGEVIDLRGDVDVDLLAAEASADLWAAADGLTARDQEILELHVRHELVGRELADALGVAESTANVALSRLKDRIAICMGSLLVARSGRDDCDELDLLLADWDGAFTIDLRGKVNRHVNQCEVCERTKGTLLAAGAFALPLVELPAGLRSPTVEKMYEASKASASQPEQWTWRDDGFPNALAERRQAAGFFATNAGLVAAAAVVLAVVLGFWWINSEDVSTVVASEALVRESSTTSTSEQVESSTASSPTTSATPDPSSTTAPTTATTSTATSTTTSSTSTSTSSTTEAPLSDEPTDIPEDEEPTDGQPIDDEPIDDGPTDEEPIDDGPTEDAPEDDAPVDDGPTEEEPINVAPRIRSFVLGSSEVLIDAGSCIGGRAQVDVSVFDDGEIVSVVASWAPTPGQSNRSELTLVSGSQYTGFVGPWEVSGFQSVNVTVTDDGGLTATADARLEVQECPIADFTT